MARSFEGDLEVAMAEVTALAAPNIAPTVDSCYDLRATIIRHQRCSFWTASTVYSVGDVVMPTVPNGYRYAVIRAGTSGTEPPVWGSGTVSDGVYPEESLGVYWYYDGPDYENIFDVGWAIYDVWMHKAGQASAQIDTTLAGGASAGTFTVNCSQMFNHCITMAKIYAPLRF